MKNLTNIIVSGLVIGLVVGLTGCAEMQAKGGGASKSEVAELKAGQVAIQAELAEIKKLLKPKPKPKQVSDVNHVMNVANDPVKGSNSATLTIVEYTDYQCPFCARHVKSVMPTFLKNYVDTGKVRYVLRDFPLSFHKNAAKASEAAHCAGDQGKYWEMHDLLFDNQKALGADKLSEYAGTVGLEVERFNACLQGGNYKALVESNTADGRKAGIRGTPSFVLGVNDGNEVKGSKLIRGAVGYNVFKTAVDEMLARKK